MLLLYAVLGVKDALLIPFFASEEKVALITGILSLRIQFFGFSGRSERGCSGGLRSRGDGWLRPSVRYFAIEQLSHPQEGAWSIGGPEGDGRDDDRELLYIAALLLGGWN